ncbi:hypothetical protein [Pseudomonas sp. RIT-PI-q]|uniref:hypothetical protein n=1 Tax=Pseudomonas sp. RIT-PI-q TaxID=1690247 RepID=UPI000A6A0267|nr:hypothetical protein [Pseudomonas sp. RIT-PI-q]
MPAKAVEPLAFAVRRTSPSLASQLLQGISQWLELDEADYVAGLYPHAKEEVKTFLASASKDKSLHNSTRKDVYDLIKRKPGHWQL